VSKKKVAKADASCHEPTFEECLIELEGIVADLENGQLGLAEALARYEQGVKHLKSCHGLLERAEQRIELLSGVDASGKPITKPFDEQEFATLEERAAARGKRRSGETPVVSRRRPSAGDDIDEGSRLF
jgi:exodeoxyribonuclease VII small subunit